MKKLFACGTTMSMLLLIIFIPELAGLSLDFTSTIATTPTLTNTLSPTKTPTLNISELSNELETKQLDLEKARNELNEAENVLLGLQLKLSELDNTILNLQLNKSELEKELLELKIQELEAQIQWSLLLIVIAVLLGIINNWRDEIEKIIPSRMKRFLGIKERKIPASPRNLAKERDRQTEILQKQIGSLTKKKEKLQDKIKQLEKVPLSVMEHFVDVMEKGERKSVWRDYTFFILGIIVPLMINVIRYYLGL